MGKWWLKWLYHTSCKCVWTEVRDILRSNWDNQHESSKLSTSPSDQFSCLQEWLTCQKQWHIFNVTLYHRLTNTQQTIITNNLLTTLIIKASTVKRYAHIWFWKRPIQNQWWNQERYLAYSKKVAAYRWTVHSSPWNGHSVTLTEHLSINEVREWQPTVQACCLEVMKQDVRYLTSETFHHHKTSRLRNTELKPATQQNHSNNHVQHTSAAAAT